MSGRDHCRRGRGEDLQEGMQLRLKALVGVVEGGELCADMQHFLEGVGGVLADYVCPAHLTGVAAGFLCRWFWGDWKWGLPESGPGVGSGHGLGTVGGLFQCGGMQHREGLQGEQQGLRLAGHGAAAMLGWSLIGESLVGGCLGGPPGIPVPLLDEVWGAVAGLAGSVRHQVCFAADLAERRAGVALGWSTWSQPGKWHCLGVGHTSARWPSAPRLGQCSIFFLRREHL